MYINTSEEKPNNDEADKSYNAPAKNPVNIPSFLPLKYPKITGIIISRFGIIPAMLILFQVLPEKDKKAKL